MTYSRSIQTDDDREFALLFMKSKKLPFTITITDGVRRSTEQNKLQRKWMLEIAEQLGDVTAEWVRGYCKLTIGVPILRAENEAFRVKYDSVVRPLTYEQKIAIMMEPLDLPVTRLMTTQQKTDYLDGIFRHFSEKGVVLTMPKQKGPGSSMSGSRGASPPSTSAPSTHAAGPSSTRPRDYAAERA